MWQQMTIREEYLKYIAVSIVNSFDLSKEYWSASRSMDEEALPQGRTAVMTLERFCAVTLLVEFH